MNGVPGPEGRDHDDRLPGFPQRRRAGTRQYLEGMVSGSSPQRRARGGLGRAMFAYVAVPATVAALAVTVALVGHPAGGSPGSAATLSGTGPGARSGPTASVPAGARTTGPQEPSAATVRATSPTVGPAGPPTPRPSRTPSWVYRNGVLSWAGDWTFTASADYHDRSGGAPGGRFDVRIRLTGAWGGWQPHIPAFDTHGFTAVTFALRATRPGQTWTCALGHAGTTATPISVNLRGYGPPPVPDRWTVYTVPLTALGAADTSVRTLVIQDQTGATSNTWYVADVGFLP